MNKDDFALIISILSLIVATGGIFYAVQQLDLALYQIEYPELNVTHQIDEEKGILNIFIKNTAKLKETGTINFYRLEISDSKPHLQLDSLKPGENTTLNISIKVDEKNYTLPSEKGELPLLTRFIKFRIPRYKLYFITEKTSISYRITCDNCYPQGITKRIPEWQSIKGYEFSIDENYSIRGFIPTYSWTTYSLKDLP